MRPTIAPTPRAYAVEFGEPPGYLDHASVGPPSRAAATASARMLQAVHEGRPDAIEMAIGAAAAVSHSAARLLHVRPEQVAVVPTTSAGLFAVAFGLRGGNVVVPAHEFPANVYPWLRAAERGGADPRLIAAPDGRVTADVVAAAVDRDTVAVAVSLVDFRTGLRVDLDALREAAGDALLVVDAVQALGAITTTLEPADVLVAGGQKWLRAGWGSGVLAMSDRALERLQPTLSGWTGVADAMDFDDPPPHAPLPAAARFMMGTPNAAAAAALAAALELLGDGVCHDVERAVVDRADALREAVCAHGAELLATPAAPRERSGILSFRLPSADSDAVARRLADSGIMVTSRGGWVRLSPHATSPPDVVDPVREVLASYG